MICRRRSITPYKILHLPFFSMVRILFELRVESRNSVNVLLLRYFRNFNSFSRGEVSPTHSELRLFVTNMFVCIGHRDNFLARCASNFPLLKCQGVWNKTCTQIVLSKSSFKIRKTTVFGMFRDSAIVLGSIRRSFWTISATAEMFTSIRVDFARPFLSSFSTSYLPSLNQEYHLKSIDCFRASFP
jgi:hypothetical protein